METIHRTAQRGLPVGAHFILGLPGETREFTVNQAEIINQLPIDTLKLHQLQIIRGTAMAREFIRQRERAAQDITYTSDYSLYSAEEYASLVVDFLEKLRPDIVVERFASSSPQALLLAPDWGLKNYEFVALVDKELRRRDSWQGKYYNPFTLT